MSLRNELRGPRQNSEDWYNYVQKGAKAIHKTNPHVLVVVSGLSYDLDLSFLKKRPLRLNLDNKIVYEAHRYAFSNRERDRWLHQPLNHVCDSITRDMNRRSTFLVEGSEPAPLFVTEFGINMEGTNPADNNFFSCFLVYLAEHDLDWNLWGVQGSYYIRLGREDDDEQYAVFDHNMTRVRNPQFQRRLASIQGKIQGIAGTLFSDFFLTILCFCGFLSFVKQILSESVNFVARVFVFFYCRSPLRSPNARCIVSSKERCMHWGEREI